MLASDPELASSAKEDGTTAILWCVYTGHAELVPLFHRDLNLFEACATGNFARAAALLDANPSALHEYSGDGHTALGLATYFRHPDIVRELIRRGAAVNQPSRNAMGVTPLHAAAAAGDADLVHFLIQNGADVNARQAGGHTAMDSAKQSGRQDIIALLS